MIPSSGHNPQPDDSSRHQETPGAELAIVIPAYKPDFLREALRSLAAQTDHRFHIYIGDDASPYEIKSIVDEFSSLLPISYHRFPSNLGAHDLVAQWERCINLTKEEKWLWLFSDDDILSPECVSDFYAAARANPEGELFHFNVRIIDSRGKNISNPPLYPHRMKAGEYLEHKLRGKVISFVVEFIFSRNLYKRVGGFQNFDLAWGADFMTWLKMAANNRQGIITVPGNSRVGWRRSEVNISPDKTRPILLRKLNALIENAAFIKKELKEKPELYSPLKYSFRWIRFPIGEIWRNRSRLRIYDITGLLSRYIRRMMR